MLSTGFFVAMGTVNTVAVDGDALLPEAMSIAVAEVRRIDEACSRFKPESELSRLNRAAGTTVKVSPVLQEALLAALLAADMTDGLVDPTVGRRVEEIGYTVTFGQMALDGPALELRTRNVTGWRAVELDLAARTVRIPAGTLLDLGASGKAWAADRAATAAARALGAGVLVECGGDVAVSGRAPAGGWPVRVASETGAPDGQDVVLSDGGLATSGTTSRRWRRGSIEVHDIIDPATGLPAHTPWAMVSVAAASCLEANAASTAALILGDEAPAWLDRLGLPARLVRVGGGGVEYTGGWAGWAA
ncbi:MAG TPA: FAD:protein FMN transferase [Candidatus Dormibacteraeota bacterium]|nr:FAD:protein FMN transferase [Candidatus Dormibacteraeota bacterium]